MKLEKFKRPDSSEENIVYQIISMSQPYWPLFVISIFLGLGIGYTYLFFATPIYQASATLLIKDEKKGNDDTKLTESLNFLNNKKIIDNEIEVLQSRTLMNAVVNSLQLYAPTFEEGSIKSSSAYLTSPLIISVLNPEQIKRTDKIYYDFNKPKSVVVLDNTLKCPLNEWVDTPYGTIMFSENPRYRPAEESNERYFTLINPKTITNTLLKNLVVSASSKLSTIVELYFRDDVPQRAEDILNELIIRYSESAIEDKNTLSVNTLAFVEKRLETVVQELALIEQQIQQYKSSNDAIDIGTQGSLFLSNVSTNDQKLSEVNMQLAILDQVEKFVLSEDNSGGIVPSTLGVNDNVLSKMLDKLYSFELEYEKLKKTVAENNPILISLTDQIKKIKPNILANIQSQREGLEATKMNLHGTNTTYNSMLNSIPLKERQLLEISREQAIKRDIYSFLLQKREESAMSSASIVSDTKIVDHAQSSLGPVSPNTKIVYLASIVIPLFLVFGYVLSTSLTSKVLYREDIEPLTTMPVIGEIAFNKDKKPIVIEEDKRTFIAEGFRELRLSLSFLGIKADHKKVLITSSIPGEGKSFISLNLAVCLSITGKRVVIVDLDLNNPSLNKVLKNSHTAGVCQFLKGESTKEEIIQKTFVNDNLYYVPTGELQGNPSELLLNGKIKDLLSDLEASFDYIIMDTAPVSPVTDAYILSPLCDATLFVVRHNITPKILLKRIEENNINPLHNAAIVFNGVKPRGFIKSNYGYGHTYEYNYQPKTKGIKKFIA